MTKRAQKCSQTLGVTPFKVWSHSSTLTFEQNCAKLKLQLALARHGTSIFKVLLVSHVHGSVLEVAAGIGLSMKIRIGLGSVAKELLCAARQGTARRKAEAFYFLILFSSNTNLILL